MTSLEPTVADRREDTMKLMSTAEYRQCANNGCTKQAAVN